MPERIEDLQLRGLRILRDTALPGYTTDAVLLADFARPKPGSHVFDLGTGLGILPLLVIGRQASLRITGIELQPELADLARRSMALNGLESQVEIVTGDLRDCAALYPAGCCEMVVSNPPYHADDGQGGAHSHQQHCTYEDVIAAAAHLLLLRGSLCLCFSPAQLLNLGDVLRRAGLEPKRVQMAASLPGRAPWLCLLEAQKGAKPGLRFEPQLTMLEASGMPSSQMQTIYTRGEEGTA